MLIKTLLTPQGQKSWGNKVEKVVLFPGFGRAGSRKKNSASLPKGRALSLWAAWNGHGEEINQPGSEIPIAGVMQVWLMPPECERWQDASFATRARPAVCQARNSFPGLTLWVCRGLESMLAYVTVFQQLTKLGLQAKWCCEVQSTHIWNQFPFEAALKRATRRETRSSLGLSWPTGVEKCVFTFHIYYNMAKELYCRL